MVLRRFKVSERDVLRMRRDVRRSLRSAALVGAFVGAVLDVCMFLPMRLLARIGLLHGRTRREGRDSGGPPPAGAGDRARRPVGPPELPGGAAREIPRD